MLAFCTAQAHFAAVGDLMADLIGRYARAARALLGWTQADLAKQARIGLRTVKRVENDEEATPVIVAAIERAFAEAGLRVLYDAGALASLKETIVIAIVLSTR